MSEGTIIEKKRRLDGTSVEFECMRSLVVPPRRAVLRYVIRQERALAGTALVLPAGTVTIAHYWVDRPYNVYHWLDRGRTLAYYCNVATETVIADDRVEYLDLAVDILIEPKGVTSVLDEDELPPDLAPEHRRTVARAVEELTASARRIAAEVEAASAPYR